MKLFLKPILLLLITIPLLASLAANVFLLYKLRYYYLSIDAVKLDPVNFQRYRQTPYSGTSRDTDQTTVVIFGDSRAAAWRNLKLDNFQFINRGISGETSAQAFLRFNDHVSYLKPSIIVVQVGVNDLRMLPLPPKERKDIIENCKENIRKIAERAQNLDATVILTTIFPLAQGTLPLRYQFRWANLNEMDKDIEDVNTYIRSLEGENLIVFDAYKILAENGKVKDSYANDLLHINSAGYEALNEKLVKILQELHQSIPS